jgi:8-oxo-dGTP pyrophosphatase MutT (NUDIX family)
LSSDYVRRLRASVGNELLLLPSVTILVFDQHGRVLLLRHSAHGLWVASGGMIEPGERPDAAALREMKEETGLSVELTDLLGVYGGGHEFHVRYPNGDEVAYVMTVYLARAAGGVLEPDGDEVLEARFFSAEEASQLETAPWLPIVLKDAFDRRSR